jgi:putative Ca2+/H+ antiporter (TMEM165/GDT1 family)
VGRVVVVGLRVAVVGLRVAVVGLRVAVVGLRVVGTGRGDVVAVVRPGAAGPRPGAAARPVVAGAVAAARAGVGQGGNGSGGQGQDGGEGEGGEAGPQRPGPFRMVPGSSSPSPAGSVRYSGPVDLGVVLTTFAVILPAELPDKSLFASLVLGTRFRPLPVFCGVAAAFAVHVVIAVAVGGVFSLLPERLVLFVAAALFAGGSALLLLGREDDGEERAGEVRAVSDRRPVRVALASFGVVFLGEWGDITQITTANLAARYRDPVSVGIGALLALWSVAALALTVGRGLVQRVPTRLVRRLTGVVLAVLAVVTLAEALRA